MYMDSTLVGALLCALIGASCVVLSLLVSLRDRKDKRAAQARRLAREQEARSFVVNARIAEEQRRANGARLRDGEDKVKARAVLGLAENREWSREEIMAAWRGIVKSAHPDVSERDNRSSLERATAARNLLLGQH